MFSFGVGVIIPYVGKPDDAAVKRVVAIPVSVERALGDPADADTVVAIGYSDIKCTTMRIVMVYLKISELLYQRVLGEREIEEMDGC